MDYFLNHASFLLSLDGNLSLLVLDFTFHVFSYVIEDHVFGLLGVSRKAERRKSHMLKSVVEVVN